MALALLVAPWVAEAADPFLVAPPPEGVERSPAFRYANLSPRAALDELDRRRILYQQVGPHGAVRTPIRLTGKLHGVHIHSALPEYERPTTPFEICDARFALALDDFSALLARHDIVEVIHYTMYRPSPGYTTSRNPQSKLAPGWLPGASLAKKSGHGKRPDRKKNSARRRSHTTQSRHPLGLAIDPGVFVKRDGSMLSVGSHFQGRIGARTCGPGASPPKDARAKELWGIVCEAFDAKIFTYVLTPNFDRPHQDHFHMDIKPGVRWFLYH